jgi:predicted nucleic acid-binding protein
MFVADTSVLGSFAAARGLELLLAALKIEKVFIPRAVQQEIEIGLDSGAVHLQAVVDLINSGKIEVLEVEPADRKRMTVLPGGFGIGEREAVALCHRTGATLLCNDRHVQRYCVQHDLACLDLARLLRLIWLKGFATQAKVKTMIVRMEKVEHLVFTETDRIFAPPGNTFRL